MLTYEYVMCQFPQMPIYILCWCFSPSLRETGCFSLCQADHANESPFPSGVSNHWSRLGHAEIWFSTSSAQYKGIETISGRAWEVNETQYHIS